MTGLSYRAWQHLENATLIALALASAPLHALWMARAWRERAAADREHEARARQERTGR